MAENISRAASVKARIDRLAVNCDTGFALAVHIRYTRPSLLYMTYRQDWSDLYSERGYMLSDPVVHWGLTHTGWVEWDSLKDLDAQGVIRQAAAHGLVNGWTYATGPAHSRTIAGLTRSKGPLSDAEKVELAGVVDEIHALTDGIEGFTASETDALRQIL